MKGIQTPVNKFKLSELQEREEFWRALWSWIPEDVKYFVLRIGQLVRVVRRDYKGSIGELGEVKFEAKELELAVYEKQYNYNDGKYYYEKKVLKIPYSAVFWLEFINEQQLAEEVDAYEVEPIPETEAS
ncbi:MAG: hypothetical protein JRE40_14275 [Deltaproteobacteria bacterium]|nr:hypothetical protein [Deltaproteobacteria bacterium]